MSRVIEVDHHTRYTYGTPVEVAQHVAYLRPLDNAQQQVLAFEMHVAPHPTHQATGADLYGNTQSFFSTTHPHRSLSVHAASRVRVQERQAMISHEHTPPWEAVRERLCYAAGVPYEPAAEFAQPSRYVPRLQALRELAAPHFTPGTPIAVAATALMRAIHTGLAYETASTAIETPLATVLAQRRGVCQDFAHVMIGALRVQGLAARYVSGYLLTEAPPGHEPIVGADASHAWVAVWVPGLYGGDDWLELDPTNDLLPSTGHVRLAVGRDYGDVAPLRGVIRGGGKHTLEVRVTTRTAQKLLACAERGDEA